MIELFSMSWFIDVSSLILLISSLSVSKHSCLLVHLYLLITWLCSRFSFMYCWRSSWTASLWSLRIFWISAISVFLESMSCSCECTRSSKSLSCSASSCHSTLSPSKVSTSLLMCWLVITQLRSVVIQEALQLWVASGISGVPCWHRGCLFLIKSVWRHFQRWCGTTI